MTTTTNPTIVPSANEPSVRSEGLRRRVFAGLWRWLDTSVDELISEAKDDVVKDLPGAIIEIGAGRGSNFARYTPGTVVTVFEPNSYMHAALEDRAQLHGLDLRAHATDLRDAGLPSGSCDAVVSTLTLCSVPDRRALVAEIHRILRPGGQFRFVEHIAEPPRTGRRRFQQAVRRPWRFVFDECDTCADTDEVIAAAGFESVETTTRNLGPGLDPTNLTHWGVATR